MNKKALVLSVLATFAISAGVVYAEDFKPLTTLPGVFKEGTVTDPIKVISGVYGLAIGIGAVIAVIMIIWGGFEYMYQESIGSKSAAKERITNAFLGLGVILASFIILQTINKDLVNFNLRLPGGSGRLQGLVAAQKNLDSAIKTLRDAQRTSRELKELMAAYDAQIASAEIASTTDSSSLLRLKTERAELIVKESTIRTKALAEANIERMQSSILNWDSKTKINVDQAIQSGMNAYDEKRKSLVAAYELTNDDRYKKAIEDNDIDRYIFQQKTGQLWQLNKHREKISTGQYVNTTQIAEHMKRNGEETAARLESFGKRTEADTFRKETAERIKTICSSCL
ncbi:MAG: pilin [bacterium]|nr:pilin [bacterium]